jgi:hypothetical protein
MKAALLSLLVASAAFGQAESMGVSSASDINAATLTSNSFSGTQSSTVSSGSNTLACTVNGERVDLGTGANDYLYSDGTNVLTPATFQAANVLTATVDAGTVIATTALVSQGPIYLTQGQNICLDGPACTKTLASNGSTLTLTGLTMTMSGAIVMSPLNSISWGGTTNAGINSGAGQYTGTCRAMANGSSWPIPSTVFHTGTVGANTSTGETTLVQMTHANQFGNDWDVNGRGYHVYAAGTFAGNNNAKTIKLKYGAGQTDATGGIFTGTTTTNGGGWTMECTLLRLTSNSTQHTSCRFDTNSGSHLVNVSASGAENLATLDWSMTLTGTGGATSDIANTIMRVDFLP